MRGHRALINVIDTTWCSKLAYVVGLIVADGCLAKHNKQISFISKDEELISNYQKSLGINKKPLETSHINDTEKKYFTVQFKSKQFHGFLNRIGVTPAKSKTIKSVKIPDRYFADFIRGLFDGDGTFWTEWDNRWPNSFVFHIEIASASREFITWLKNQLTRLYNVKGFIKRGAGVFIVRYAKGDSRRLFSIMYYRKNSLCLTRKYMKIKTTLDFDQKLNQDVKTPR